LDFECSTQTQESNYLFLLDLQQYLLKKLKAGAVIKDVYASGLAYVKEKKPELESAYPKTIGYGVRVAGNRRCQNQLTPPTAVPDRYRLPRFRIRARTEE
jgi:nucleosome binding factor SPN SPT16 subunit